MKDSQILNSCRAGKLLKYQQKINSVRLKCTLDLKQLFPSRGQQNEFNRKWDKFIKAHPQRDREIFRREGKHRIYFSEQLIPAKKDSQRRKPLLLLLGNPASHSVREGMFFSFEGKEGKEREHRFWKALSSAGILDFAFKRGLSVKKRSLQRKERLLSLKYTSDYRIGLAVFISFPSPATDRRWSGVDGVERLFGKKAMEKIIEAEKKRILQCARKFLSPSGAVVCFNKVTWESLRCEDNRPYTPERAKHGRLSGRLKGNESIELFCVPPTRLAGQARKVLSRFAKSHFVPRS